MPGISDALHSSVSSLASLEHSLFLIQSNVGNASTPGYARQDLVGVEGFNGGNSTQLRSSRDEYAEQAVRRQSSLLGKSNQLSTLLGSVEPVFGASADSEIPKSISAFFGAVSALTANPNDARSRQLVLDQATSLTRTFNSAARSLQDITAEAHHQVSAGVDSVNRLASLVRDFNVKQAANSSIANNATIDARLHDTLQQLSEFADVQVLKQNDGSISLLLGGQTALVSGQEFFPISADLTSGPSARIVDSNGGDITSHVTGGQLSGALDSVNQYLPSYRAGLDQLASGIADQVNLTLAAGVDSNGNPGQPLFTYQPPNLAATLTTTGLTTASFAAASVTAPGGNGNALALAALETTPAINGYSFTGFYGSLASTVGRNVADAKDNQSVQKQLLTQAETQRNDSQGVSLDEEAIHLVQYQRAYQAAARLVSVLDSLSEITINMIH